MDEQRLKARQAKSGLNPGPGAYDVRRPIVTASEVFLGDSEQTCGPAATRGTLAQLTAS